MIKSLQFIDPIPLLLGDLKRSQKIKPDQKYLDWLDARIFECLRNLREEGKKSDLILKKPNYEVIDGFFVGQRLHISGYSTTDNVIREFGKSKLQVKVCSHYGWREYTKIWKIKDLLTRVTWRSES